MSLLGLAGLRKKRRATVLRSAHTDGISGPSKRPPCYYEQANLLGKLTFSWMTPVVKQGQRKVLREADMPELPRKDTSEYLANRFQEAWDKERDERERPRLWRALLWSFAPLALLIYPCLVLSTAAKIVQATVGIENLVLLLEVTKSGGDYGNVYIYASVIVGCGLVMITVHHMVQFLGWRLGLAVRTALTAAVYRKALRLPQSAFAASHMTPGYIINLCAADVERFQLFCVYIHYLLLAPFEIAVMLYCGLQLIGLPFVFGMAVLFVIVPTQAYLARNLNTIGKEAASLTDQRIRLSKQAVEGARIIKMSGWELALDRRISLARAQEVAKVLKAGIIRSIHEGLYFLCPSLAGAATFITASVMRVDLSPGLVFSTLTLFNILQWDLVNFASKAMQTLSEVLISLPRLEAFFLLPECGPLSLPLFPEYQKDDPRGPVQLGGLRVTNLSASWNVKGPAVLRDVNLTVYPGQLVGVVGQVASAKSSLLLACMRELKFSLQSSLEVHGRVAYAPQEPWILTGTMRDNILMGRPFEPKRYREVVKACCLMKDMKDMAHGDLTVLADRGINLSGGQKARLGLARLAYTEADIYLIDDVFSALDGKIGRKVFRRVITELLASKTRVLATHQLHFFASFGKAVDRIVVMRNGSVVGKYKSVTEMRQAEMCGGLSSSNSGLFDKPTPSGFTERSAPSGFFERASHSLRGCFGEHVALSELGVLDGEEWSEGGEEEEDDDDEEDDEGVALTGHSLEASAADGIVASETQSDGDVTSKTYLEYIKAVGGYRWVTFLGVLFLLAQGAHIATTTWLSYWTHLSLQDQQQPHFIAVYVGLVLLVALFAFARAYWTYRSLILGSQRLHDTMMWRVLRAVPSFFDANPTGRILNRATKDVQFCDTLLPYVVYDFLQCLCTCLGVLGVVTTVNPWLLLLLPPLSYCFWRLRTAFLQTSREARRLESVARSPVFALLGEALEGLTTIRRLGASDMYTRKLYDRLDAYSRPYFIFVGAGRHMGFRVDFLCWLMVVATTYSSLEAELLGTGGKSEYFGMSIMYVLQLAAIFQWCIRQSSEVENYIVAVERILEYCHLPQEAPLFSAPGFDPPSDWPQHGGIKLEDVEASYRPGLRPVLRRLTFNAFPGSKVGIVGRTGAGKTSALQVLFRLIEPSRGDMWIDGVSITELGLHDLRKKLSVIPQVPFLFSASMRENLDPESLHTDMELWDALEEVQMKDAVERLGGLYGMVAEGGGNLSAGERQLICLARAILQNNRILVLDEATANIDMRTDALIQTTLRNRFADATVIAVAHRLQTIIDCDQVVVLKNGSVDDSGHPYELLKKGRGPFYDMVHETGAESEARLREQAEMAWWRNFRRAAPHASSQGEVWYGEDDDFSCDDEPDDFDEEEEPRSGLGQLGEEDDDESGPFVDPVGSEAEEEEQVGADEEDGDNQHELLLLPKGPMTSKKSGLAGLSPKRNSSLFTPKGVGAELNV